MTRLEAENIHPPRCDHLPVNFKTLQNCLKESRNSLSPTDIFDGEFRSFMKEMLIAQHEVHVLENVLSIILGAHHYSSIKNHLCDNWIPIIDNDVVIPRPGFFDGVQLELEDFWIQEGFLSREDLYKFIFPSSGDYTCPFLPNFFGEAKGSGDSMTIGRRQVCYHGAYGARGMHRLQNYMSQEIYDEVARTFSFVYSKGFLYMYAHHMSQPDGPNTLPHYHMNHLGSWALSNSWQTTVEALTAVRNVRDLACDLREQVLDDAKQRQGKPTRPHAKNDATNSLMWIVPAAAGVALVYFAGVESLWVLQTPQTPPLDLCTNLCSSHRLLSKGDRNILVDQACKSLSVGTGGIRMIGRESRVSGRESRMSGEIKAV